MAAGAETRWPLERDEALRALWMQDQPRLSATEIAAKLGTTKNAVIGRVHRLKLPSRVSPIQRAARGDKPKPVRAAVARQPSAPKPPPAPRSPPVIARTPPVVRHRSCQWVEGNRPAWRFCDAPTAGASSYCAEHHARCFVKPDPSTAKPINAGGWFR